MTATAAASAHEHQMPTVAISAAPGSSSATLSAAKTMFSAATMPGRWTPTRTLSCMTKIDHSAVAATNPNAVGPCRMAARSGAHTCRPATNTTADAALRVAPIAYARATIRAVRVPACGTKRSNALMRFSCASPAKNIIADTAVAFEPTTAAGYMRAAISQKTNPIPAVSAEFRMSR